MPKKKWHERSEADKRRIDNWVLANKIKQKDRDIKQRRSEHNKKFRTYEHAIVSKIHWVKDTPHSRTIQFMKWQEKKHAE
jgi:hypothetical protein